MKKEKLNKISNNNNSNNNTSNDGQHLNHMMDHIDINNNNNNNNNNAETWYMDIPEIILIDVFLPFIDNSLLFIQGIIHLSQTNKFNYQLFKNIINKLKMAYEFIKYIDDDDQLLLQIIEKYKSILTSKESYKHINIKDILMIILNTSNYRHLYLNKLQYTNENFLQIMYTPLAYAAKYELVEVIDYLLNIEREHIDIDKGFIKIKHGWQEEQEQRGNNNNNNNNNNNINNNNNNNNIISPLFRCIEYNQFIILKMLVEAGANLNVIDTNTEDTPLYVATREGNYKMVKYLLSRDTIDINQRCGNNRYHRTSLFLSILPSETRQGRNRNRIFNLFIEHPNINVNLLDTRNGSPLFYACKYYHYESIRKICLHRTFNSNVFHVQVVNETCLSVVQNRNNILDHDDGNVIPNDIIIQFLIQHGGGGDVIDGGGGGDDDDGGGGGENDVVLNGFGQV